MSLPSHWREVYLLDVCTLNPRLSPAQTPDASTPLHFVNSSAIDDLTGTISASRIRKYGETSSGCRFFQNDDVVFTTRGPEIGKAAIADGLLNGIGASQVFSVLRASSKLSAHYLLHFVRQSWFRISAEDSCKGTTQRSISNNFFSQVKIPLPPFEEQLHIVEVLRQASISPYRTALEHACKLRDAMASLLIMPPKNYKDDGTRILPLLDVCDLNPRRRSLVLEEENVNVRVVTAKDVDGLSYRMRPQQVIQGRKFGSLSVVFENDVLFSVTGTTPNGSVAVVGQDAVRDPLFASGFDVLSPSDALSPDYLAAFLRLPWIQEAAKKASVNAIQRPGRRYFFSRLKLRLPLLAEQKRVIEMLDEIPLTAFQNALDQAVILFNELARQAFGGSLSSRWSDEHQRLFDNGAQPLDIVESVDDDRPVYPKKASVIRPYRQAAVRALSAFQKSVWTALVEDPAPTTFPDDANSFDKLYRGLNVSSSDDSHSDKEVHHALEQLAALGLIRKMSVRQRIAENEYIFLTGLRAMHEGEDRRIKEDTGVRDAQSIRTKIIEKGRG